MANRCTLVAGNGCALTYVRTYVIDHWMSAVQAPDKPGWPRPRPDWVNGSVEDLVTIGWADTWRSPKRQWG
jgi:hypothetical protein